MKALSELSRRGFLAGSLAVGFSSRLRGAEEGFEPLFNGKNLSGWEGDPLLWVVENGELVGRSPGISYNDFLSTEDRFGDFELRFEVRLVDDKGNSGVQFRSERVAGSMEMIGYQADIGPTWWGNLYDESRRRTNLSEADPQVVTRTLKPDKWNDYTVRAKGPRITLQINGKTMAEYVEEDDSIPREGHIAVQVHSGPPLEARFRNMRIKKLAA